MDGKREALLEDLRQLEHLLPVGFAFLLPYLQYWQIVTLALLAFAHALWISPRLIRATTRRGERQAGYSPGKIYYAVAVLFLVLFFRDQLYVAAAIWGLLAVGDSTSNVVGRRWGRHPIPYNRLKTVEGSVAFWIFGAVAAWGLFLWNLPEGTSFSASRAGVFALSAGFLCAVIESLPSVVDDNLAVTWSGSAAYLVLLATGDSGPTLSAPFATALLINLGAGVVARGLGWLSWRGTLLAFLVGTLTYGSCGISGYLVLVAFLVLGSVATRAGLRRKQILSVAQAEEGARGISNILANGFVPIVLAIAFYWTDSPLLHLAYLGAVATAAFDTVSTEIGQWLGKHPFNPVNLEPVPVGTPGAISVEGTLAGLIAAGLIGLTGWAAGWIPGSAFPLALLGATGGAMWESVVAARFKFDFPFSDEALNLHSTVIGAMLASFLGWVLGG